MKDLDQKWCAALEAQLTSAGIGVYRSRGQWVMTDERAAQAIIDEFTVEQHANDVAREIDVYARQLRDTLSAGVSPYEAALWPIKLDEAKAGDGPTLDREAAARQITKAELASKIIAKSDSVAQREADIAGIAGKHKDTVRALRSHEAVQSYDWRIGWPE